VSIFVIGMWFWASLAVFTMAASVVAALSVSLTGKGAPSLARHMHAWRDSCRAAVAFQEPLSSSPSHHRPF
jgi:hypothetical protein